MVTLYFRGPPGTPLKNGLLFLPSEVSPSLRLRAAASQWGIVQKETPVNATDNYCCCSLRPPCGLLFSLAINTVVLIRLSPQTRGHFKRLVLIFSGVKSNYSGVLMTVPSDRCFSAVNSQSFCQELITLRLFSSYKL